MTTNHTQSSSEELRAKITEIKDRLAGRIETHRSVAKRAGWSQKDLEQVIREDGWIFEDEMLSLFASHLQAYTDEIRGQVICEDERHDNGQKMVNDPSMCMDCANPDERFCRNEHRAKQRQALNNLATKWGVK